MLKTYASYSNESSMSSFTLDQSALDAFSPVKNTTTKTDDGEELSFIMQKSHASYPNESSLSSFTLDQSALDLFTPLKNTTTKTDDEEEEEEESNIGIEESFENIVEASDTSNEILEDSIIESMEIETPRRISHGRQETPKSILGDHPKEKELCAAPLKSQPIGSREGLLLPRFRQPTTSSNARASPQLVSCASPRCRKKSSSLTPQQNQVCQEANHPSNQKPRFTPKKRVAIVRRIADQSFNAAKLPILDMSNYEGIPRAKPVNDISIEDKTAHPLTPQQSKMSSTPAAANKERFNQIGAHELVQEEDDRMEIYDNDAGNFSALSIDSDAHEDEEEQEEPVSLDDDVPPPALDDVPSPVPKPPEAKVRRSSRPKKAPIRININPKHKSYY